MDSDDFSSWLMCRPLLGFPFVAKIYIVWFTRRYLLVSNPCQEMVKVRQQYSFGKRFLLFFFEGMEIQYKHDVPLVPDCAQLLVN